MVQVPLVQPAVPWLVLQAFPHEPQFATLVLLLTSQPVSASPSQLPYPALHVMPQAPPTHVAVPLVELQTFAQLPHLDGSLLRLISQPLEALPSQLP